MHPLLIILTAFMFIVPDVILAHSAEDFRCSHVPPTPDQITHVWLNNANFSTSDDGTSSNMSREPSGGRSMSKRHTDGPGAYASLGQNPQGSLWSVLKGLEESSRRNDLIPIKIHVHYDNSVHQLDQEKFELITELVMPTVVKFFEGVLSIRRNFTIERFRISRRCPNNTIYYARDPIGQFRPYCMDRCEDYALCGEVIVPPGHLSACSYCNSTSKRCLTDHISEGAGVPNTQLLLYVSARQTSRCKKDQTIAYAAHCAQDAKTDRPVAGHANLCPSSISTDPKDLRALVATVKHELTHVLGFSVSLFAYYRDKYGQPLTERDSMPGPIPVDPITGYAKWSDKIIRKFVRTSWVTGEGKVDKEVHIVVTPTVVQEAKKHFNCSSLEGAELEDQGSDGTSMTHWEKRLFENEAMTGTHTQNSVYSRLTLAVLQDTGWYVANFSRAEKLEWGRDLGCDFAKRSCKSWIDERRAAGKSISPFCDRVKGDLLQISCTEDRNSKAVCNLKQYKERLPSIYKNFDHIDGVARDNLSYYGGSVDLADYCPFIQEFSWQTQNVTVRGSRCDFGGDSLEAERNAALENYGPHTRCFEHGRRWEQRSCVYKRHWHHYGAGCYKYSCTSGHVNVAVGNNSYPCYYSGQIVTIELVVDQWLYNGTIVCPPCEKICPTHKCKSYDKRVIDKILSLGVDDTPTATETDNSLRAFIDETINSIDDGHEDKLFSNSKVYTLQSLNEPNEDAKPVESIKIKEHRTYKEHLLHIVGQHKKRPRQRLVCSGSGRLDGFSIFVLLITVIVTFCVLDRRQIW